MQQYRYVSHEECDHAARIAARGLARGARIWGVPRGGIPAAYLVARYAQDAAIVNSVEDATVIVDDLVDSGRTMMHFLSHHHDKTFRALFDKRGVEAAAGDRVVLARPNHYSPDKRWYVFPWEVGEGKKDESGHDIAVRLLQLIGEDPKREGLAETPARFVKAWRERTEGYRIDAAELFKSFEYREDAGIVLQQGLPVVSLCEHHLADIVGTADIAYIPNGKVVGLSKLARVVDAFSRRLQVQERLTSEIANAIQGNLSPLGVAVVLRCRHHCMVTRGVRVHNTVTTTSAMLGAFRDHPEARAEFLALCSST